MTRPVHARGRTPLGAGTSASIFTFPSTHHAMAAEDVLRHSDIWLQVIPAPANLDRPCGLAVRVRADDAARARTILDDRTVLYHGPTPDRVD